MSRALKVRLGYFSLFGGFDLAESDACQPFSLPKCWFLRTGRTCGLQASQHHNYGVSADLESSLTRFILMNIIVLDRRVYSGRLHSPATLLETPVL